MPSMLLELIGYVVFELIILHNNTTTVSHCRHLDNITFCVFPNVHYKEIVVELTETCPNQGVLNYKKLIENCPK